MSRDPGAAGAATEALRRFQERTGLDLSDRARPRALRALEGLEVAAATAAEVDQALVRAASVPESYLFREPDGWRALRNEGVLARLAGARGARVWSAGCARGEEPVTLALLLDEAGAGAVEVLATDMDEQLLAQARQEAWSSWSLRALPPDLRPRFVRRGDLFHLSGSARRVRPRYLRHGLLHEPLPEPWGEPGGLDLVICRNVLIYFHAEGIRRAFELFARLVRPGGHLLLATTDPWPQGRDWRRVQSRAALFERVAAPAEPRARGPAGEPHDPWLDGLDERAPVPRARAAASAAPVLEGASPSPGARSPSPRAPEVEATVPGSAEPDPLLRARFHHRRGEDERALAILDRALREDQGRADLRYLRGELRLAAGRASEAAEDLRKALYLSPDHPSAALAMHRCAKALGDRNGAARYLRMAEQAARSLDPTAPAGEGADVAAAEFLYVLGDGGEGEA